MVKKIEFSTKGPIYKPEEIKEVLAGAVNSSMLVYKLNFNHETKKEERIYTYNIPCAFDIETSSFYKDENGNSISSEEYEERQKLIPGYKLEKVAIMYCWQFGINGRVIIGRTWEQFEVMLNTIAEVLELNEKRLLRVYVHNLSYEFQYLSRHFSWAEVFAGEQRKPYYAITSNYVEFRCSLMLSGKSLAKLGEDLQKYKVEKVKDGLNYKKIRHHNTPLTSLEKLYCENDVRVVMAYIQEKIENEGGILKIPLTKTGYVRNFCRDKCLEISNKKRKNEDKERDHFYNTIHTLNITSVKELETAQKAFQGGFTHANPYYSCELCENVASYDFSSSYPSVMVANRFPMSTAVFIENPTDEEVTTYIDNYSLSKMDNVEYFSIFRVRFINLLPKVVYENPLSASKCTFPKRVIIDGKEVSNVVENNGRIVSARAIETTITNVDFSVLKRFYTWDECYFKDCFFYRADYLPVELVHCVLNLYEKKTVLKDVIGEELEYSLKKEMLNSTYGMAVTNPLREENIFEDNQWLTKDMTEEEKWAKIEELNNSPKRFLFYLWGVFITAHARFNLFTMIEMLENDYIYSDTDSVKFFNLEKHKLKFETYNRLLDKRLKKALAYHDSKIKGTEIMAKTYPVSYEMTRPKTQEGEEKPLGAWDFEGVYSYFKTLGAKRYLTAGGKKPLKIGDTKYPINLTVSGVNKYAAAPYIFNELAQGDIKKCFEHFQDNLYLPAGKGGKPIHTYIDYEQKGKVVDYLGEEVQYHELSSVHLEESGYQLTIAHIYGEYLDGLKFFSVGN